MCEGPFSTHGHHRVDKSGRAEDHPTLTLRLRGSKVGCGVRHRLIEKSRKKSKKIRFALDSLLEGAGFEPSVPRKSQPLFKSAYQMALRVICTTNFLDHSTTKSLNLRRFNRDRANKAGFCEALHQKTVGNKDALI